MNPAYDYIKKYRNVADCDAEEEYNRLMIDPKDGTLHIVRAHETYCGKIVSNADFHRLIKEGFFDSPNRGAAIIDRIVSRASALRWLCETFLPEDVTIKSATSETITIGLKKRIAGEPI